MKVTFILRNKTEHFFNSIASMGDRERYFYLLQRGTDLSIPCKVGSSNSLRDKMELRRILRNETAHFEYKLEARRGYKLATFDIE